MLFDVSLEIFLKNGHICLKIKLLLVLSKKALTKIYLYAKITNFIIYNINQMNYFSALLAWVSLYLQRTDTEMLKLEQQGFV
jgi:hypothetical protein